VIDLLRTLTNPKTGVMLDRLVSLMPDPSSVQAIGSADRTSRGARRARHGLIEQACLDVLANAVEPMRLRVIHDAVEVLLGVAVSHSSIKSAAIRLTNATDKPVVRVAPGLYRNIQQNRA
jgi:hypothetical protein